MSLDEQVPQYPGQPDYPAGPPQPQRTSGLAITGFILAFLLPLVGFILSLIAVFKTGAGRAKGRGLAIAGVIVSVVIMGVLTFVIIKISDSTVIDPGCTSGKAAILDFGKSTNPNVDSVKTVIKGLNDAAAKAKHDNVRDAMKAAADDFSQFLKAVQTGKIPDGLTEKLDADGTKIDSLCTVGG